MGIIDWLFGSKKEERNVVNIKFETVTECENEFNKKGLIDYLRLLKLEDWFNSFPDKQKKLIDRYSKGFYFAETKRVSQSSMDFVAGIGVRGIDSNYKFGISMLKEALKLEGSKADLHFTYQSLIQFYDRKEDYKNAKKYCYEEIDMFPEIKESLKNKFGESIEDWGFACRDRLLEILTRPFGIEEDYCEALNACKKLLEVGLLTKEKFNKLSVDYETEINMAKGIDLLDKDNPNEAIKIFNETIKLSPNIKDEIYKEIAGYYYSKENNDKALEYYQKALKANPLISGVKSKIKSLSKKLGITIDNKSIFNELLELEKKVKDWWELRDLANEFSKIKEYNKAWGLYNKAILLRVKQGQPCDTIYSHMAKMLVKEKKYKNALMTYLLNYREMKGYESEYYQNRIPKYLIQGIEKCLKYLKKQNLTCNDLFKIIDSKTDNFEQEVEKLL